MMNKNLTFSISSFQVLQSDQSLQPIRWLTILALMSGFLVVPEVRASAQELPGCFLKNQAGNYVRLNNICIFPDSTFDPNATASASGTPGVYSAQIIRRQGGIPVIQVVFNENQTFEMLVDTGASGTAITPVMAELLGVIPTAKATADTPSQKNAEFDIGLVESVSVGGATMPNLPVAIAPALDLGLLGQDFFGRYDVTIKKDVIEFRERS
ncbi:aspartyl protease family protein [Lyngbya aestuarii BL J]|uniref:Aspartyl protease family protein n=1 Tax=Lyngbya aestuarii BL J TaxID=1348334 RepID=U7QCI0_9CYAN|nr:retropepsin-like aspartic protease [Lyngbya aestuarii]ERT04887.1 aspartyl protease family protein [Lyngbya aestuarii BL J]